MNPGIVTAAVTVVGVIAAALCYIFNDPPQQSYGHRSQNSRDNVYNYNINQYRTNNYYPSDKSSKTEEENKECKKEKRKRVKMLNNNCTICLENLTGEIDILPCKHAFHVQCLEKHYESRKSEGLGSFLSTLPCRDRLKSTIFTAPIFLLFFSFINVFLKSF